MLYRKIAKRIEDYFLSDSDRLLVIDGARQIGKSYIIRYVGQRMFPNYIEINMEEDKLGNRIFAEARTTKEFYLALSVIAGDKMKDRKSTLVFIDEIQAYDHLFTLVKFLMQEARFTYIASGSQLGIALKNTQSIPVGSLDMAHMFPMDFEEFLYANGVGSELIEAMRDNFNKNTALSEALHEKMLDFFKKYLLVGGLPQAVDKYVKERNVVEFRNIQREVHSMYAIDASKYEQEHNRRLKIRRIFEMVPSNLENKKKRLVIKDIENKSWKRSNDYSDEFEYLVSAGVVLEAKAISKPSYPLLENSGKNLMKLYLNDVGMLSGIFYRNNILAIMSDMKSINLGSVYETVVAQELRAHGYDLYYYDNKKNGEVDFLIDDPDNLSNIPIEVKSGKDYTVHSALDKFLSVDEYGVRRAYVLSNERDVYVKNGITYIPIYYIMFFENVSNVVESL
ncbi:MAG: ATP-binding protein [Bacteroidetes bacterium]|uniref:ATP-binding protein n=1 Tax=Candidatus Merdivivens pullistercoris TaxID=2840873 RepID=A0A9D9I351_9BACT|nr:ATP-binding protein [Candidatus Merdivivens pullistercoris]